MDALPVLMGYSTMGEATQGIEFAMTALFLVIFTDQMREAVRRGH